LQKAVRAPRRAAAFKGSPSRPKRVPTSSQADCHIRRGLMAGLPQAKAKIDDVSSACAMRRKASQASRRASESRCCSPTLASTQPRSDESFRYLLVALQAKKKIGTAGRRLEIRDGNTTRVLPGGAAGRVESMTYVPDERDSISRRQPELMDKLPREYADVGNPAENVSANRLASSRAQQQGQFRPYKSQMKAKGPRSETGVSRERGSCPCARCVRERAAACTRTFTTTDLRRDARAAPTTRPRGAREASTVVRQAGRPASLQESIASRRIFSSLGVQPLSLMTLDKSNERGIKQKPLGVFRAFSS